MDRLSEIRTAEALSHLEVYSQNPLFQEGSWLAKPVKTVMDLLPFFENCIEFRALDLGCGVGRNCIPIAQAITDQNCRIDCVDILEFAIEKLKDNAIQYGVDQKLCGVVSEIADYEIEQNCYNLIIAVSALEHLDSEPTFIQKLSQIRDGIKTDGIVCLIVNTSVHEHNKSTGVELSPQFEVKLETDECRQIIDQVFSKWKVLKDTVAHQKYDVPRADNMAELETDVVTFAAQKIT